MSDKYSLPLDWNQVFTAFDLDPTTNGLQIVPATSLRPAGPLPRSGEQSLGEGGPPSSESLPAWPALDPKHPALVVGADAQQAGAVLETLLQYYSTSHLVTIIDAEGLARLLALGDVIGFRHMYLPPAEATDTPQSFDTLRYLVARLRGPGGCPWDREQTHASLRPYLVEEAYEALEALDEQDSLKLREELGDLLLQVMLHSQLAYESGRFSVDDVVESISLKLIRRHPHVFGQVEVSSSQEVLQNWDAIKKNEGKSPSLLASVPRGMPALAYAQSLQKRAARTGFDWPSIDGALEKVHEEIQELQEPGANRAAEFGDLLFALVNVARWIDIDAEEALRQACRRFFQRFSWMEAACARQGVEMGSLSLAQLDLLWEEAKLQE
jgi:tetrapyrrole methylase family protein / MazG family protein